MRIIAITFLTLIIIASWGQKKPDLILTKDENEKWLSEIQKLNSREKFDFLKARLLADTNVYLPEGHPDKRFEKGRREGKQLGVSKVKLSINDKLINLNNFNKTNQLVVLCDLLTTENFKMRILDAQMVSNLNGLGYDAGIFHLQTKNKIVEGKIGLMNWD